MGYYTKFDLKIFDLERDEVELYEDEYEFDMHKNKINAISDYANCFESEIKWYKHESDMLAYSKIHPKLLFCLYGKTEDGVLWVKYFLNGKMQFEKAKQTIEYPKFNMDELR